MKTIIIEKKIFSYVKLFRELMGLRNQTNPKYAGSIPKIVEQENTAIL